MRFLQFGCCLTFPLLLFIFFVKSKGIHANRDLETTLEAIGGNNDNSVENDPAAALKGRLIFSHVLYRHGDRMPIQFYPTDPWKSRENWPTGPGQLTNIGKMQHFKLGQWLRKRYNSILNLTYSNEEIYIRSTDVDRTLMSALSNLAGLFPPSKDQVWNPNINWQPIPVHTLPDSNDEIMGKAPCAAYEYAFSEVLNSPEFKKYNQRFDFLYKYLSNYTGRHIDSMDAVQSINNTLYIESLYNKTLPEWTKAVYPSVDMTFIADFYFSVATYTRKLARLKAGPLVKDILERFVQKTEGKLNPNRSVWIYSAHDTTVSNLLNALKVFNMKSPEYASCVMLELRLDAKQQPFVSVFYKNSSAVIEPSILFLPGCGYACPLKKMFTLYKDILPVDWEEECKLSTLLMTYEDANISTAMGILVGIILVMLFLSYVILIYYRRHNYRNSFSYSQVA